MKKSIVRAAIVLTCIVLTGIVAGLGAQASESVSSLSKPTFGSGDGEVLLPLSVYTELHQQASDPTRPPRLAPAGYALGNANVTVIVNSQKSRASGKIQVSLSIDVLENEWVLIPVLPAGTPVGSVTVGGKPVQLLATPEGLVWATNKSGSYSMQLTYTVDAASSEAGFTLPVPLPRASAINLTATLPGTGLDATVIPAAGTKTTSQGSTTRVTATVPTTNGVQISWRTPSDLGHTISRARYSGKLSGEAIIWTGELSVELFNDGTVTLQLLPSSATLSELKVDGKPSTILVDGGRFATLVKGQGLHKVVVVFQTPIRRTDGPPRVDLQIPQIPVSRFDLTLPGKKELTVSPASNVTSSVDDKGTVSTVYVPMTSHVSFSWSEAVPDEIRTETRTNVATYHTIHADEGVLYVHAIVEYEISRGETNIISLQLPPHVQVNRIDSDSGAVADWRIGEADKSGRRVVTVFLDRQLRGKLFLNVYYDRSLPTDEQAEPHGIDVPLIRAVDAQRQKGMVALLANTELTLNPIETEHVTKVGENQLPPFVRQIVEMTVAHTYKYTDRMPRLVVEASTPERAQGKFDAQVDTLISLGDVTLTGSASVQINVKSGRIMELQLSLPRDVSLLNLTAPSLRTYKVNAEAGSQRVDVEFTQEMEGQFRLDLTYERILVDGEPQVGVPTLSVLGAEVEQGRLAVEALTAVEVKPAVTQQLSSLDINELPQQLILKTTNPILLAYKYVHADPPPSLTLEVTRHRVIGVQEAVIDRADYRTLFTSDGLLVTIAEFTVRNSRKQFLRLQLPADSQIWSTFVDGKPEKPAMANGDEDGKKSVLIKIINSTRPFSVQLIYASTGDRIRQLGAIEGALPNPDILVTHSRWDVFLPEDVHYAEPSTNMEVLIAGDHVSGAAMSDELARLEKSAAVRQAIEPLRISVPTSGVHYAFEKLYANQSDQEAWFALPYASSSGFVLGQGISLSGTALLWLGVGLYFRRPTRKMGLAAIGLAALGLVLLFVSVGVYHLSPTLPLVISLALVLLAAAMYVRQSVAMGRDTPTIGEA